MIGACHVRHPALELRRSLDETEVRMPSDLDIPLILDTYSTQKTVAIQRLLVWHPRFHLHFT